MPRVRLALAVFAAGSALAYSRQAAAIDLTDLDSKPIKLDVTETTVVAQHFAPRAEIGPANVGFYGYFDWLNRLNVQLSWWRFTFGMRLDSAVYANRPPDQPLCGGSYLLPCLSLPPSYSSVAAYQYFLRSQEVAQFNDSIYPAKIWGSYLAPGLEVTAGDSYVQFGRGLILSMRKIDELGLDTTLRGGKIAWQKDPFALTVVAGFANPARVDEATGASLFTPNPPPTPLPPAPAPMPPAPGTTLAQPIYGSDRVVGLDIQAGRGLPVTLATHAVRFTRCSPVHYDSQGNPYTGAFSGSEFLSGAFGCDPRDTQLWLQSLPTGFGPMLYASDVGMLGQSLEIPSLGGHGKFYVEAALQDRYYDSYINGAASLDQPKNAQGNAIYGSLSLDAGPLTNTLEVKSFRNFYPMVGAVNINVPNAIAFGNVLYSIPPTTEAITQDSEIGFFGVCVNGGRLRSNVRVAKDLLVYGAAAYYHSQTETLAGTCDSAGNTIPNFGRTIPEAITDVWDGVAGIEWFFDDHLSHAFASTGARDDNTGAGTAFYHELHFEYAMTKHLAGPYSLELTGHHRFRYEEGQNQRNPDGTLCSMADCTPQPWHEGDNYLALKVSPKFVFSQGFEYTTLVGLPTTYWNGSARWNFRSDSSVVLFIGEQRGGLRCISGVCRVFPAFEGARLEATVRF